MAQNSLHHQSLFYLFKIKFLLLVSHWPQRTSVQSKFTDTCPFCLSDAMYNSCLCVLVAQSCLTLCDPMDYSLPASTVHDKNTGVGSHSLLEEVFLTQGPNLGLLHYRWIPYHLSHIIHTFGFGWLSLHLPWNMSVPLCFLVVSHWHPPPPFHSADRTRGLSRENLKAEKQ